MIFCLRLGFNNRICGYYALIKKDGKIYWQHKVEIRGPKKDDFPLPTIYFEITSKTSPCTGEYIEDDFKNANYISYLEYKNGKNNDHH